LGLQADGDETVRAGGLVRKRRRVLVRPLGHVIVVPLPFRERRFVNDLS
jgi:hypothetical protein